MAILNDLAAWLPSWQGTAKKLEAYVDTISTELTATKGKLLALETELATTKQANTTLTEENAKLRTDLEAKCNEVIEANKSKAETIKTVDAAANNKAIEILAQTGVSAPVGEENKGNTLQDQYTAIKASGNSRALSTFLTKHGKELLQNARK